MRVWNATTFSRSNFLSRARVCVDTPLEVCEQRDAKGIYEKARRGEIKNLTGINDPYESPQNPEIVIETDFASPEQNARSILAFLKKRGFVLK